ncbi:hypothetical protein EOM09_04570 [bacterium]|nr:hypothetical protein [bacterium]
MIWSPKKEIAKLPEEIKPYYLSEAEYLFEDLRNNKLKIVLIPAPRKIHQMHMIRVLENPNPFWYKELYSSNNHFRRDRSIKSLIRIIEKKDKEFKNIKYKYDFVYRELIHDRLINGFDDEKGNKIYPNNKVKYFFEEISYQNSLEKLIPFCNSDFETETKYFDDVPF